jgi:hypothetical protein
MAVTGHIPSAVGLDGVLAVRQHLEHVEKIVWATVGHDPDSTRIPEIVQRIRAAGVFVTPTLHAQQVLNLQGTRAFEALFERPENQLVEPEILAWWRTLSRPTATAAQDPASMGARLYAFQQALTRQLFQAGVPLLFGTDTPNPLLVPGYSVHDEIAALTEASIPLYDVLRSATAVAGAHLGGDRLGTIVAGAPADLILVRDDPLLVPATLRRPDAVLVGGRHFDRAQLDDMRAGKR